MLEGKNNYKAWLYLLPALILLGIFSFYPIVNSFIISFVRDYHPVAETFAKQRAEYQAEGLGYFTFENFKTVIKGDYFKNAIVNTLLIAFLSVPVSVILSLVISVLLISIKKLRGFFQTLFFLPYVTSAMAVSMAFTVLFTNQGSVNTGYTNGPINTIVKSVGLEGLLMDSFDRAEWKRNGEKQYNKYICQDKNGNVLWEEVESKYTSYQSLLVFFPEMPSYANKEEYYEKEILNDPTLPEKKYALQHKYRSLGRIDWVGANATWNTAITVVILYSIWSGLAFKILVFTGGLTSIDKQYYDAAKIDATSKWRTFWRITVPMMSPLIVYILITSLIGSFKTYTSIVGLFGDTMGPAGQPGLMMTFVGLVYQYMGEGNEAIHFGAAAAVTLFVIIFVVTQLTNKITRKKTYY